MPMPAQPTVAGDRLFFIFNLTREYALGLPTLN